MDGGSQGYVGARSMFLVQPKPTGIMGKASSPHTGGIIAGLGDGSVRFFSANVDPTTVWWRSLTPAQGDLPTE